MASSLTLPGKAFDIPHPPNFIVEVLSYNPHSQNNRLDFQQVKMIDWIMAGVESGILNDGPDRNIHLYCRTNLLNEAEVH
ncbi:hypothetical protein PPL_08275 [Heterostelium album PN500]|uniref:Uncharacterized protein n=1 Tax=Heterostelium pallidum (strain ATCC 26659 / Pp 5 / PN500) TaxID=670386 RepID=D3BHR1_HETP5|nr:hypothetical protein PPL_08275 [Heterostelium album PN500]EFA78811.1 hypothetical protein PPL_08275 [Heterostelium album PN500]|eukprot:XP_020430935.1 hypothetical protein PPL_08275 [Heterostelium album PN500]